MFPDKTRVLLILPQDVLDRARVLAGRATAALKLPVSLQIVLRALIEEGLKAGDAPALLSNIEGQAKTVRHIRSGARRRGVTGRELENRRAGARPSPASQQRPKRRT